MKKAIWAVFLLVNFCLHTSAAFTDDQTPAGPVPAHSSTDSSASAAGIKWTIPSKWAAQPSKPMRVATYLIPAAKEMLSPVNAEFSFLAQVRVEMWAPTSTGGPLNLKAHPLLSKLRKW